MPQSLSAAVAERRLGLASGNQGSPATLPAMRLLLLFCLPFTLLAAELTADPAVLMGTFDNGLRYAVMANQQPKDKVTLRLQVQCGSLQESAPQRGLAHFLEHLAFNGTTNYPPGTLVERLQHLGLAFGAHTNAHTSFEETVYKLDLPDAAPETIATGLGVMADWAGGMLLEAGEIDKERGIILSELRDRDGAGLRQARARYGADYAGTVIGERLPIGVAETLQAANRELIASYYAAFYRPERMVMVVVGAIDPQAVVAQLRSTMGGVTARGTPVPSPDLGSLVLTDKPVVRTLADAESEDTAIAVVRIMPLPRARDDLAHRRDELLRALAEGVVARRIRALVSKDPACPLQDGGAFSYYWVGFTHAGVQGTAKPSRALEALRVLVREYRRLVQFGPTVSELAVECKAYATQLETAVAQAATRTNPQLAQGLYTAMSHHEVVLSPQQERDLLTPMLAQVTVADIVESLQAYRAHPGRESVTILGREDLGPGADEQVAQAVAQVWSEPLTKPVDQVLTAWAYPTDFEGSRVAGFWTTENDAASGIEAQTRGGLRIQSKSTTFQPNQILVQLRFEAPLAGRAAGIGELIERGFFAGGLGKHSADDEATLFADSSVQLLGISVGEDAVTLAATCTPSDYQRCLERLAAHVIDPGWRLEVEERIKQAWLEELKAAVLDVDTVTERTLQARLVGNQPARRAATPAEAQAVTFAQARAWLEPILRTAPLTVSVVGDVAQAKGYPDIVFATAKRQAFSAKVADGRQQRKRLLPSPPIAPGEQSVTVTASVPKALVRIAWPADDIYDISQTRRLNLLAQCFNERLRVRIREELGAAYSPGAWYVPGEVYRGSGWLQASIGVAPAQVPTVLKATWTLADELAATGIDEPLLDQVKAPLIKGLAARLQRNDWWLNAVLTRLATQPFRLEWSRTIQADFAAITAPELSALAKQFLINSKAVTVIGTTPLAVPALVSPTVPPVVPAMK